MQKLLTLLRQASIPLRVATVIAVAYLGFVFLSRRSTGDRWTESRQPAPPTAEKTSAFEATYGGTALKILQFYASEGAITEGASTSICYGLVNAKSVRIDPPVRGVSVSLNRCVEVSPERTTRYTLTAEGNDNTTATASFELTVKPDVGSLPRITRLEVTKHTEEKGRHYFMVNFAFENGHKVSIDPPAFAPLEDSAPFGQFYVSPDRTTTYTLTVTGAKGRQAQKQLTLEVPGR